MNPYLSIVLGIGGNVTDDLTARLSVSMLNIFKLATKFSLSMELVIVDWNMPTTHTMLVVKPESDCQIRIIHTPQELHKQIPNPYGFKYFEWYPKNIGIRRARGEFVLSTNPDDLWSEELAAFLARRELQHGHFYRVNRHDMIDGKVFRICYPTGGKAPHESEEEIRRPSSPRACPWSPDMLHYSAAGDFTLMAKDDWFMIHGNPERDYNDSVDGQTLWLAHQKGLKQVILPYPIYHPDHPRTLNLVNGRTPFNSNWDDNRPHAKENSEEWGFAGMEFEETLL